MSEDTGQNTENNDPNDTETSDCILSISWNNGILGAVYYNLDSSELTIVHEVVDTRPDFTYLSNLLRQICPAYLLINGSPTFNTEIINLLDIPEDMNHKIVRKRRNQPPTRSNIILSSIDKSKLPAARARLLKMHLPGMPDNATESMRNYFISSVFPLEQTLVVYSLANILEYLEVNFKHLFRETGSQFGSQPVITNVNVCQLEGQMLIDQSTLYGLQIFSPIGQPNSSENKRHVNLFNLLNQCSSHLGTCELREIMMQPTRDIKELQVRHATVEWCMKSINFEKICQFRRYLRKIRNLSILFKRIVLRMGKSSDFKSFKSSIYYAYLMCEDCSNLDQNGIENTFLKDLSDFMTQSRTIKSVLFTLDKVVNLSEGEKENRFVVNFGLDPELDQKKELLNSIERSVYEQSEVGKLQVPEGIRDFYLIFMQAFGFVIAAEVNDSNNSSLLNNTDGIPLEMVFQKDNTVYFKTRYCEELNQKYGDLYGEICCHEKRIFDRLIKYLTESLPELVAINKLCAKFDCMIAFASVAIQRNYVKPEISDSRGVLIQNGRHPLIEIKVNFVPNNTCISEENNNLITILSAPNATGKSAYMKQLAMICYMAHIGSFVPADYAKIGIFDSIYTRIYCPESIHQGESSFMADLKQMSHVLLRSTSRSLVLIDEFGKGTNIREGQALLASCINNLASRGKDSCITIISTHFHDVLKLIYHTNGICLKTIKHARDENGYRSLYEIIDGYNIPSVSAYEDISAIFDQLLIKNSNSRDVDVDSIYSTILGARFGFALSLVNMVRLNNDLDMNLIQEMYNKANLQHYL